MGALPLLLRARVIHPSGLKVYVLAQHRDPQSRHADPQQARAALGDPTVNFQRKTKISREMTSCRAGMLGHVHWTLLTLVYHMFLDLTLKHPYSPAGSPRCRKQVSDMYRSPNATLFHCLISQRSRPPAAARASCMPCRARRVSHAI